MVISFSTGAADGIRVLAIALVYCICHNRAVVKPATPFRNISVVLVDTHSGANIGAAARAMKNMGLRRLKLVNPCDYEGQECRALARKAIELVRAAEIYSSLDAALAEENLVIGTTSTRERKEKQPVYTPREVAPEIWEYAQDKRVALVFGPERRGLTEAQLAGCQYLVSIPAHPGFPVLNLAHSVTVMAYEIFNATVADTRSKPELASHQERQQMYAHMEQVLVDIGFLSSQTPDHIMGAIRRFLGRAQLSSRDVQIIRGIMGQMEWYVQQGHRLPPDKVKKP
jgi:tRNA/rRNA methyltransferase